MIIIDVNSNFTFFDFQFVYHTSSDICVRDYDHLSYTANVDFRKVMITPFKKVVIPPPLSEKEINLIGMPKALSFYKNYLFVLLKSKIAFIDCIEGSVQYVDIPEDLLSTNVFEKILFIESEETTYNVHGVLLLSSNIYNKK